jgi:hypothetical protein
MTIIKIIGLSILGFILLVTLTNMMTPQWELDYRRDRAQYETTCRLVTKAITGYDQCDEYQMIIWQKEYLKTHLK